MHAVDEYQAKMKSTVSWAAISGLAAGALTGLAAGFLIGRYAGRDGGITERGNPPVRHHHRRVGWRFARSVDYGCVANGEALSCGERGKNEGKN